MVKAILASLKAAIIALLATSDDDAESVSTTYYPSY